MAAYYGMGPGGGGGVPGGGMNQSPPNSMASLAPGVGGGNPATGLMGNSNNNNNGPTPPPGHGGGGGRSPSPIGKGGRGVPQSGVGGVGGMTADMNITGPEPPSPDCGLSNDGSGMGSDDEEGSESMGPGGDRGSNGTSSTPPMIYPWMKKVHLNQGECKYTKLMNQFLDDTLAELLPVLHFHHNYRFYYYNNSKFSQRP